MTHAVEKVSRSQQVSENSVSLPFFRVPTSSRGVMYDAKVVAHHLRVCLNRKPNKEKKVPRQASSITFDLKVNK